MGNASNYRMVPTQSWLFVPAGHCWCTIATAKWQEFGDKRLTTIELTAEQYTNYVTVVPVWSVSRWQSMSDAEQKTGRASNTQSLKDKGGTPTFGPMNEAWAKFCELLDAEQ